MKRTKFYSALTVLLSTLFILVIAYLDYSTSSELYLEVLYFIPILLAAWYGRKLIAIYETVFCALLSIIVDLLLNHFHYYSFAHIWNFTSTLVILIVFVMLIIKLKHSIEGEKYLARTDFKTKALNSLALYEIIASEMQISIRHKYPLTLAYIDVDNFKSINDTYGHSVGDVLLLEIVNIIKNNIRKNDAIARLGGDEFAILFPRTGKDGAKTAVENIRDKLMSMVNGHGYNISFSIGVVIFIKIPSKAEEMISLGDQTMYAVKESTKNSIKYVLH